MLDTRILSKAVCRLSNKQKGFAYKIDTHKRDLKNNHKLRKKPNKLFGFLMACFYAPEQIIVPKKMAKNTEILLKKVVLFITLMLKY